MTRSAVVLFLLGSATFTGLIGWQGIDAVSALLAQTGQGLLWFGPYYFVPLSLATISWRQLFPIEAMPSWPVAMRASWIGFSVNWLLPVAQIGGELVKARFEGQLWVSRRLLFASC